MKRTLCSRAPVISLLSPSLAASRRAIDQLAVWTNLQPLSGVDVESSPESLNSVFSFRSSRNYYSFLLPKLKWESLALQCPETGTILHWLSVESNNKLEQSRMDMNAPHELLAVQDCSGVTQACNEIATRVGISSSIPYLCMSHKIMGRPITVQQLLASGLPLLNFRNYDHDHDRDMNMNVENSDDNTKVTATNGCLKEIVIPAYDDETDHDGYTLLDKFSVASTGSNSLARPCTGLYQFQFKNNNENSHSFSKLCVRPLPAAEADTRLPPPSLVFHTDSVDRIQELALATTTTTTAATTTTTTTKTATAATTTTTDMDVLSQSSPTPVATAKIGYNGTGKGQIMVQTGDWTGLDVRFCQAVKYSSMFAEAQASLQAGSLPELQRGGSNDATDALKNKGDCWVEFRANLRHPAGFMRRRKPPRIAKIPDLPYE